MERLAKKLEEAGPDLEFNTARIVSEDAKLGKVVKPRAKWPVLVHRKHHREDLVGIITAFDLL
jgi:hypothetical protein